MLERTVSTNLQYCFLLQDMALVITVATGWGNILPKMFVSFTYCSPLGPCEQTKETSQILFQICFPAKEQSEQDCDVWVYRFKREGLLKLPQKGILLIFAAFQ